jgi:hypothetical protein
MQPLTNAALVPGHREHLRAETANRRLARATTGRHIPALRRRTGRLLVHVGTILAEA